MVETNEDKTRILLADDHHVVRQGIRVLLEREEDFTVIGETDNVTDTLRLTRELRPHVLIMEARLSGMNVTETTRRIKQELPETGILILTTLDDQDYVFGLLGAGANGYMLKNITGDELMQAICFVRSGEFVSHPLITQKMFRQMQRQTVALDFREHLTHREMEVLKLVARGMNNRDIAGELGVGLRTVKSHLESIFSKIGVNSRTEAVLEAMKHGWVSLEDQELS